MRLIDADKLEPSEVYMNYGFTRIVYMDDIDEMPTVDPVKHGHWIAHAMSIKDVPTEACSECGEWSYGYNETYCPNCGAKMDEVEECSRTHGKGEEEWQ